MVLLHLRPALYRSAISIHLSRGDINRRTDRASGDILRELSSSRRDAAQETGREDVRLGTVPWTDVCVQGCGVAASRESVRVFPCTAEQSKGGRRKIRELDGAWRN
jgi:hypothetical protein